MATVIYNHREMEYKQKQFWKKQHQNEISFEQLFNNTEDSQVQEAGIEIVNSINKIDFPEDYAMDYGFDTMRLYIMFEGAPGKGQDYEEGPLEGIYKFLNRLMILVHSCATGIETIAHNETKELKELTDQTIKKQLSNLDLEFGVKMHDFLLEKNGHMLVAGFMEQTTKLSNVFHQEEVKLPKEIVEHFLRMLAPFAPYMSEALWLELGNKESVFTQKWPEYDSTKLNDLPKKTVVAIQINGKTKTVLEFEKVGKDSSEHKISEEEVLEKAKQVMKERFPEDCKRRIYVEEKVLNFIVPD